MEFSVGTGSDLLPLLAVPLAIDELRRAVECGKPFGHAVEPWKTWSILEDLERYPNSSSPEIHQRIGPEINARTFKRVLDGLIKADQVLATGKKRWTRYRLRAEP